MKKSSGLWVVVLISLCNLGYGQSYASLRSTVDTVTLGDPINLQLTLFIENDVEGIADFSTWNKIPNLMYDQDTVNFTEFADYAILDAGNLGINENRKSLNLSQVSYSNDSGGKIAQANIRLAIYDVGIFDIPAPKLTIDNGEVIPTQAARVMVILPPEIQKAMQDSIGIAPIKPIIEESMTLEDYKYFFIVLGLILASFIGYYFLVVKKKRNQIEPIPVEIYIPPHVTALEKLSQLKDKQLWQQGKIKEYQSELTFIIREYLEKRYHFSALEMTTGEILKAVPEEVNRLELKNILQIADLVKFAKASPPEDLHSQFLDKAFDLVHTTKKTETLEND